MLSIRIAQPILVLIESCSSSVVCGSACAHSAMDSYLQWRCRADKCMTTAEDAVLKTVCIPPVHAQHVPYKPLLVAQLLWLQPPQGKLTHASAPAENMHSVSLRTLRSQEAMPQATAVRQMLSTGSVQSKSQTQLTFLDLDAPGL